MGVFRHRVREGMRAGVIAAAATAGALVALGRTHGAALRPLNSVGHIVVGSRAYYMVGVSWITLVALAVHVASVALWGVILALATVRMHGWALYSTAVLFAGATWFIDYRLVPERLRPGFESGLSPVEIGLVYVVMGLSLAWGLDRERQGARG
jgi:hypothetical protein